MTKFVLLSCLHYMKARSSEAATFDPVHCPKCDTDVIIDQVHTSSFRAVCKDCRYRQRYAASRSAYGAADRHYQDTGHTTRVLVDHPAVPSGSIVITSWDTPRAEQLELGLPF